MNLKRILVYACAMLALGTALGGCVIVPVPIGHGRYERDDRYDRHDYAPDRRHGDDRYGGSEGR
jgi:hypothetical protein